MSNNLSPDDYQTMYHTCKLLLTPIRAKELDLICRVILNNESIYKAVEQSTLSTFGVGVPYPLVAVLHFRESDQSFKQHLHNGDPLDERTVHEPKGRPQIGMPPFTWLESAVDAFSGAWYPPQWDIAGCLEFLERYNGLGYQQHGIHSPYIWDYTNKYTKGLYMADGRFNPHEKEYRPGCAAILKALEQRGVSLKFSAVNYTSPKNGVWNNTSNAATLFH